MPGDSPPEILEELLSLGLACTRIDNPHYRPKAGVRPGAPPDKTTLVARLEAVERHWDEPQVFAGRLQAFLREGATPPLEQAEVQSLRELPSNIGVAKLRFWVERPEVVRQLEKFLRDYGVCVLYGFPGVGKSCAAAQFAYRIVKEMLVRWLPCTDGN